MKKILKKFKNQLQTYYLIVLSRNKILCALHYSIVSLSFYREFFAVFSGKMAYYKNSFHKEGNVFLLRRNTHRIEKGLIMRPLKDVFALEYIGETVENFIALRQISTLNKFEPSTLQWCEEVLIKYFNTVAPHPVINSSKKLFFSEINYETCKSEQNKIPYKRQKRNLISYQSFHELCIQRRSVRWFQDKKVPRDIILKAIDATRFSPSACNRQPFYFRIFDDKKLAQEVGAIPGGTKGFNQNFQAIAVVVGDFKCISL
jgi:hypothetical protein